MTTRKEQQRRKLFRERIAADIARVNTEEKMRRENITTVAATAPGWVLVWHYAADAAQQQILAAAARCLDDAERARSLVQRVRAGNAARRLLRDIPKKEKPIPTLAELRRRSKGGAA
jgi:hypothetical protein